MHTTPRFTIKRTAGLALIAACALNVACNRPHANPPPEPDISLGITSCPATRPQACTREYRPVCGRLEDRRELDYSNACTACADEDVIGHRPRPCEAPAP